MTVPSTCPECGKGNLYRSAQISAGGGEGTNYLPDLGTFLSYAKFQLVVCRDCGLIRQYASKEAVAKLAESKRWTRL